MKLKIKKKADVWFSKLILIILAILLLLFLIMWMGKSIFGIKTFMPKIFHIGR